jgi:hypothetical protein
MIDRDPDAYLRSLYGALNRHCQAVSSLQPAPLAFHAAKSAVSTRMKAIDEHAMKFENLVKDPKRPSELAKRLPIENQVLFDFFANGLSALESFCFASYYVGAVIDSTKFNVNKKPRDIVAKEVSARFNDLDPADGFTLALSACLSSSEFQLLTAMRNMLLHTLHPGRSVRVLNPSAPHEIDLDLWRGGDWSRAQGGTLPESKLKFLLTSDALIKQRDWIDGQLESLSLALPALAAKRGLI